MFEAVGLLAPPSPGRVKHIQVTYSILKRFLKECILFTGLNSGISWGISDVNMQFWAPKLSENKSLN